MGFLDKRLRQGLLLSIGIPVFLLGALVLFFDMQQQELKKTTLSILAVLCALPNLFFFFRALKLNNDTKAFGILLGCILWALFTFGIKLLG